MDENQLECQECRQSYGSGERCPRSLFCGHTFCTKCLDRAIVSGRRRCSSCGRPFIATSAAQLPTDYALLRRCSARADDAGSLKTPGTPAYNLKLQNADSSSSTRHSSGASSHDSRFVNSASSSSNMQTLSASNHDDSKSLSSTSSSSLPTYNTSGFPSKSSSTDSSPFDLQTYSSRLLSATEYSQKDLSSGAPQITKNYFFPPIDTVTITTSSLTPRFSSAPAVTRSLSSPSDSRLGSSFLEKEKFCDNAIVNRDETDSPRSSVLMRILNKEEPSSRPPALTYKFPTIRTRFSIGNRESKASLESNNDDVRSSEEGVRSLHGELKKKRSSPLTTSELSFKNSAKTEAEQSYVVSSHSRHNTSRSDSLTKMHPELKCTPAKDISSVRLPLTSRVSKIANQDQRLADSKTIEQPDSAISCPVSSAQPDSEVSITSQGSVPSLSKFNAKLHAPSEEKQAQIREDNISASDRQLGSDTSVLESPNKGQGKHKGTASSTPSHVLNMCRSITTKSRQRSVREATSSSSSTDNSSSGNCTENRETLSTSRLSSRSRHLRKDSSLARLRSFRTDPTTHGDGNTEIESNAVMEDQTVARHPPKGTYSSSLSKKKEVTGTRQQSSASLISSDMEPLVQEITDVSSKKQRQPEPDISIRRQDVPGTSDKPVTATLFHPTKTEEVDTSKTEVRSSLLRSMSTGPETTDESKTRVTSREVGKLTRSTSLGSHLLARTNFVSETIREETDENSTVGQRSPKERSDDHERTLNDLDTKFLDHSSTSLRARLRSRTSFLSRTLSGEEDSITHQQLGKDMADGSEEVSLLLNPNSKLTKLRLEMSKSENEGKISSTDERNSLSYSAGEGTTAEGQQEGSITQSHENLMRINSQRASATESVDSACSAGSSYPLDLKTCLPTSPPPIIDNVSASTSTTLAKAVEIRQVKSDHRPRDKYVKSYGSGLSNSSSTASNTSELVTTTFPQEMQLSATTNSLKLSNSRYKRKPSDTGREDSRILYSRMSGTDKLAELQVGSVPSVQSEADDEDTEEDTEENTEEDTEEEESEEENSPQRHETLLLAHSRSRLEIKKQTLDVHHEVNSHTVEYGRNRLRTAANTREKTPNEDGIHSSVIKKNYYNNLLTRPTRSDSHTVITDSNPAPSQGNKTLVARTQKRNLSHTVVRDSVQDIWRARNARLKSSLTARLRKNSITTDETSEREANSSRALALPRDRHQLRNTTSTDPPLTDQRRDSYPLKMSSRHSNHKGVTSEETSKEMSLLSARRGQKPVQSRNSHCDDESNSNIFITSKTEMAATSTSCKESADLDGLNVTHENLRADGQKHCYLRNTASDPEVKMALYTPVCDQTKTLNGRKHEETVTNESRQKTSLLQCSETDADSVDGPNTVTVSRSFLPRIDPFKVETNLDSLQTDELLQKTQDASVMSQTQHGGTNLAEHDSPTNSQLAGYGGDNKNDIHEARLGVSLCDTHGSLLHLYCTSCEEWACDECLDVAHCQPPQGRCHLISAPDAIVHMKMTQTEFLNSRVDTLDHFREELRKLVDESDSSIKEHDANINSLRCQMYEEASLLTSIESMKTLALQKLKQIDYWENLLRQNASCIRQSSTSQEMLDAVHLNETSILANIIEGTACQEIPINNL